MQNSSLRLILLFLSFTSWFLFDSVAAAEKVYVVMRNTKYSASYNKQAEEGFWVTLEDAGFEKAELSTKSFDLSKEKEEVVLRTIKEDTPDIVLTFGGIATRTIHEGLPTTSVIFALVTRPVESGIIESFYEPSGPIAGVSLDVSILDQIKAMKEVRPNLSKIGVIYDPNNNYKLIKEAEEIASTESLVLVKREIQNNSELTDAFNEIVTNIEMLWLIPDGTVFPRDRNKRKSAINQLIGGSRKANIPSYGVSTNYVKIGATLSLSADYADAGKQAGELAVKILNGTPPLIPIEYPRSTKLSLNLGVAKEIGLNIPESVIKKAEDRVFTK